MAYLILFIHDKMKGVEILSDFPIILFPPQSNPKVCKVSQGEWVEEQSRETKNPIMASPGLKISQPDRPKQRDAYK